MRIIETASEMVALRADMPEPVALMATLGGMHRGHEALLHRARRLGTTLAASLFLNPTQFGELEDLDAYPVDTERDLRIFREHGVDYVFKPSVDEMYPAGGYRTVDPGPIGQVLEGKRRPGHFVAVATVVGRILTIIRPNMAVWGAKDAQQNLVIKKATEMLGLDVVHHIEPTVRDQSGLALSSRNAYLSAAERRAAAGLYRGLKEAAEEFARGGDDANLLRNIVRSVVAREPLIDLDYVSAADPVRLAELETVSDGTLLSLAAIVGRSRLIDNVVLGE